jgi:hypothetical protein
MIPPLIGSYSPPAVCRGDHVHCIYRDALCKVTGMHDGRIPWPRVRTLGQRGGSGLLVNDTLVKAIRTESAAALVHWFGVNAETVWRWRKAFVPGHGKFRTPGSERAHQKASQAGAEGIKAKVWTDEELDARAELSKRLGLRPPNRWTGRGGWTSREVRLLFRFTDVEVAARTGRTVHAVRAKRRLVSRPTPAREI